MEKSDKGRAAFYKKFWKVDVEDPKLYDLTVDTSKVTFGVAAEIVATAARGKLKVES
jgi:cytidylate kinase